MYNYLISYIAKVLVVNNQYDEEGFIYSRIALVWCG